MLNSLANICSEVQTAKQILPRLDHEVIKAKTAEINCAQIGQLQFLRPFAIFRVRHYFVLHRRCFTKHLL
ncbi:hypothetical protein SAMN05216581_5251 [Pseudomonas asplenii]|uniref:Uncharacterized protein n=1 Tax=Pseudomonas asplenii TaxID=53407 RepID=A0A1H6P2G4_9PSED|nr:hypothetical protein SAMN05216581_5251 [Pseudomonas fuscovaginae]